jgi:bifunctional non-homologous end joining protein LigD
MATPEANALAVNTPIQHSLFYKDGSSDKVYHMQLKPKGNNWVVEFQYGRRHQSLQAGTKTQKPLSWVEAKKIYDKLYKEKTAKGYTLDAAGTPYQGLEDAGLVSGMVPQLLNFVDEDVVAKLVG